MRNAPHAIPDLCDAEHESIREDERQRMAREIHDELGQQLLVLRMEVVSLSIRIAGTHPLLDTAVNDVLRQFDTTMRSLRNTVRGLRPTVLDLGVRAAVEWQCAEWASRTGITCDLAWNAGESAMTDRHALTLFRTLQESLTNIHRHAQATHVQIDVRPSDSNIVMAISDNGVGLERGALGKKDASGIRGIKDRVAALGGRIVIDSPANGGTTLKLSLPASKTKKRG